MSEFQPCDVADASAAGAQGGQTEQVRFGQRAGRLLQGRADGCVESRVGNDYFLSRGGGDKAGQSQHPKDATDRFQV